MAAAHEVVNSSPADKFSLAYEQAQLSWCPANVKKIEEALKEMTKECTQGNVTKYYLPTYKFVFERIHNILEFGAKPEENTKLGSFLISLFQFINALCEEDSLGQMLRDDYGLLYYISQLLDPALPYQEIELFLRALERLTGNFIISWKPPYLEVLVQKIVTFISGNFNSSRPTHLALQFLVNICRQNSCCVMMVRFDPGYRQIWKLLGKGLSEENDQKTAILISHLLFLLNPSLPAESLSSGYKIVIDWTERVLKNYEKYPEEGQVAIDNTCAGLYQTSELMKTIVAKMELIYEPLSEDIHHASASNATPLRPTSLALGRTFGQSDPVSRTKDVFLKILLETLKKLHDFISKLPRTDRRIADGILQYVQVLLPSFLPVSSLYESYKTALRIMDHLFCDMKTGSPEFMRCLTVYLHIIEQVVEGKERQINQSKLEIDPHIQKVLNKIQLTNDMSPPGVELNQLFIRLLSNISSCPNFSEEVLKKFDFQLVHHLVKNLTSSEGIDSKEKWHRSQVAVELLSTMSKFSQNTQVLNLLLTLVTNREISRHIANCIQNGDERAIRNALNVTGSTAFAENAISSITKSLTMVRQQATAKLESNGYGLSANAANGAIKLNQLLKSFDEIRQPKEPLFGDMLSFYKMKQEMHEHELASINAHVYQLNKTISHLKTLIEKQNEFSSKRIFIAEQSNWEVLSLQQQMEKMTRHHAAQTAELKKDAELLQTEIKEQEARQKAVEDKVKACQEQILSLQQEVEAESNAKKDLAAKLKTANHDNRTLKKDNLKVKTELDETKNKVALLEAALKQKEEEKEKADMLLEKEKKMLDTIRGLVGNKYGNLV